MGRPEHDKYKDTFDNKVEALKLALPWLEAINVDNTEDFVNPPYETLAHVIKTVKKEIQ